MSRRTQENILALLIIGLFIAVIVASMGYGPRARLVPLPIATLGVLLALAQLIYQNLRPADELQIDVLEFLTNRPDRPKKGDGAAKPAPAKGDDDNWGREAVALGFVALLTAIVLLLGPVPAIFLFTAGYVIIRRQFSWPMGLAFSAVFTATVYVLFGVVLEVPVDETIFGPLFSS